MAAPLSPHETHERYLSLFTHNPHTVYSLDLTGRFESVNRTALGLSGYAEADLLGRHFAELVAPDQLESATTLFMSAASGTPEQLLTAIHRSNGERVELSVWLSPIVVDDVIVGVYGVAEDITDRLRLERELQRTQEAVAVALDGVMISDEDHLVSYVNDAAVRLHGYSSAAEMIGRRLDRFVEASERRVPPAAVPTLDEGGRWVGEAKGRRKDETVFVLEASISRLPDRSLVLISRDVTARVAAGAALRASEERHRLVAEVTREVIWDADLLTGVTKWSGAVRDVFGLPCDEAEIDLEWWRSRLHPDDASRVIAERDAAFASTRDQFSDEYRLRDFTGRYVSVLARGRILRDERGHAIRFLGSMMDITRFRQQEEELRLARRVAEDANDAKSLFLANMSHELRTPLTTVIAGTEMVMDTPLSPAQLRLLERVNRAGGRLLRLVDDLLDLSAIESGDTRVDEVPFDPTTVVTHAAGWAREACRDRQLDFRLTTGVLPRPLIGDPDRLGQVLTNLLGNAVKFTSSGSVRLEVTAIREMDRADRIWLRFEVHDTGIGVDHELQEDIFKSFQQGDPGITRRYGGNGLGLAISKELVRSMGGSIGVESEPEHGSTFHFEVPFRRLETSTTERDPLD